MPDFQDTGLCRHFHQRIRRQARRRSALADRMKEFMPLSALPQVTNGASDEVLAEIAHLAKTHDKIQGNREIGLDYHYLYTDKDTQVLV